MPVLCGSALDNIGVQPLLDAVAAYLPSPADVPPVEGVNPQKKDAKEVRKPDADEPFCGLLFKIQADRHGDLHYIRVYSGKLKAGSRVYNPGKDKKENVPQLWRIQADRREQVEWVEAGDIVGVVGFHHSITGDTLCETQNPILLESITFPETVVSMAIEPESSAERKKLADVLEMMKRQDPTFRAKESEETGQTLISGMGELHLEIIRHRLQRDYRLNVKVHKPRVSYRETIGKGVEVTGQCHRHMAGQNLFAELTIRMEPFAHGTRPVTVLRDMAEPPGATGSPVPGPLLTAALEVLNQQGEGGGLLGFPLMHVKVIVRGGKVHETESNELAFRLAAADAFDRGLRRRASCSWSRSCGWRSPRRKTISASSPAIFSSGAARSPARTTADAARWSSTPAPLATLFGYSNAMRGLSQGRASCTMEPASYEPAPEEVVKSFS